ncbi:hypothetical protein LZ554_002032 [Drepanopeziza brunnea f. sp. 'monogermtubi']|nr:hypothetical protein LZ554_002032 [Drepanopeziza brunnea f. sp. 'monogermtubi']
MGRIPAAKPPYIPPVVRKEAPLTTDAFFADCLGTDFVIIEVGTGPKATKFYVHKKLLCKKVEFFDKMFKGHFAEALNGVASLPTDSPSAFKLFVGWLYTTHLEVPSFDTLLSLFIFAEKYNVTDLADQVMDTITSLKKFLPDCSHASHVYQNTHAKSKMRLFICRSIVFVILHFSSGYRSGAWDDKRLQEAMTENRDLCRDIVRMLRLQAGKLRVKPCDELPCDYHQHAKEEKCPYGTVAEKS